MCPCQASDRTPRDRQSRTQHVQIFRHFLHNAQWRTGNVLLAAAVATFCFLLYDRNWKRCAPKASFVTFTRLAFLFFFPRQYLRKNSPIGINETFVWYRELDGDEGPFNQKFRVILREKSEKTYVFELSNRFREKNFNSIMNRSTGLSSKSCLPCNDTLLSNPE